VLQIFDGLFGRQALLRSSIAQGGVAGQGVHPAPLKSAYWENGEHTKNISIEPVIEGYSFRILHSELLLQMAALIVHGPPKGGSVALREFLVIPRTPGIIAPLAAGLT